MRAARGFVAVVCCLPFAALAEVMDKEPSLVEVWLAAAVASIIGFLACRWRWWLAFVTLPLPLIYLASFITEVTDPYVGPAIRAEAGTSYVFLCSAAFVMVGVAHVIGVMINRRSHLTTSWSGP